MKALLPKLASNLELRRVLPAGSRTRLFRQSRCLSAALMLLLFPAMAALSLEPSAVMASLVLFGILPAAIALDVRRPAQLDRAVLLSFLTGAVVLFAGTLRGLDGIAAIALLAVAGLEALLLTRSATQQKLVVLFGAATVAMIASAIMVEPVFGAGTWSTTAVLVALVANVSMLVLALIANRVDQFAKRHTNHLHSTGSAALISQTIISLEKSGVVLDVSENSERLLGLPKTAFIGRGLVDLTLVSERPALLKALSDAASQQKICTVHLHMRRSTGDAAPSYRWVELIVSKSEDNDSQLIGALRDIDDQKFEDIRMKNLEDAAEQAKRARGAFLSTINHELRTPLNAIIGFSEILSNPNTIPVDKMKTQEYASLIHGAGRDLFRKISAMVDITRLDAGVYEIEKETTDLRDLLASAIESFRIEPDSPDVTIEFSDATQQDQNLDIDIDSRAIRSVMHQLLSNAAKFGGKSKPIEVRLSCTTQDLMIAVKDSGPGIPPEKLELLGKHFARIDETLNRAHGGVGLGLSLTRGIMALHDGSMSFNSKAGKGTSVMLTLPRQTAVLTATGNLVQLGPLRAQSPPSGARESGARENEQRRRHG